MTALLGSERISELKEQITQLREAYAAPEMFFPKEWKFDRSQRRIMSGMCKHQLYTREMYNNDIPSDKDGRDPWKNLQVQICKMRRRLEKCRVDIEIKLEYNVGYYLSTIDKRKVLEIAAQVEEQRKTDRDLLETAIAKGPLFGFSFGAGVRANQSVMPTADQVARIIVAAAREMECDPIVIATLTVPTRRFEHIPTRVHRARIYAAVALDRVFNNDGRYRVARHTLAKLVGVPESRQPYFYTSLYALKKANTWWSEQVAQRIMQAIEPVN